MSHAQITLTEPLVLGVIQGRLSPRPPGKLQAFPGASWRQEFYSAAELGFAGIEWIYEADRADDNPIVHPGGRRSILETTKATGTRVLSVCGDYFMVHRLSEAETRTHAVDELRRVIEYTQEIGASRILLPLLEEAALDTPNKRELALASLREVASEAKSAGVVLGLEMEISGLDYRAFLDEVGSSHVRAYYDTGNSTAAGFDVGSDSAHLIDVLAALHLKDRVRGGKSRFLGHGDTNFVGLFSRLRAAQLNPPMILQHYFENPLDDAVQAREFIEQTWHRAGAA